MQQQVNAAVIWLKDVMRWHRKGEHIPPLNRSTGIDSRPDDLWVGTHDAVANMSHEQQGTDQIVVLDGMLRVPKH
ncbi:hypothetical protein ABIB57_003464 [Devosia sp. UYZn731]|uniref:hypothetical protein n=1 Tax=Devosia sp. UYZn731 TaxID=3156345 RepID=UPI00339AFCAE